jgi:hypothetical protein
MKLVRWLSLVAGLALVTAQLSWVQADLSIRVVSHNALAIPCCGGGGTPTPTPSPTATPFQCARDANGKCSQLLINTDKCVQIGLPTIGHVGQGKCPDGTISNDPATGGAIVNYLRGWLQVLNGAIALVIMLMIVIAGIQYITSIANPTQTAAAKKRLTNAILALVLWLMMAAILQFLIPGGIL